MSCRTYIIDLTTVKCIVGLVDQVDDSKLKAAHDMAHLQVRERIGKERYDALIAAIAADNTLAGGANEKWRNMLEEGFLKEYVAWLTYHKSIYALHSAPDAAGFFAKSGSDYKAIDSKTLAMHEARARDGFQLYEKALMDWVEDNEEVEELPDNEEPNNTLDEQHVGGFVVYESERTNYDEA